MRLGTGFQPAIVRSSSPYRTSSTDYCSLRGREAPHFAQKLARLRFLLPHFGHPLRPLDAPPRKAETMIQMPATDPPMHSTNITSVIGPTNDLLLAWWPGTVRRAPDHHEGVYIDPPRSAFIIPPTVLNAEKPRIMRGLSLFVPGGGGGGDTLGGRLASSRRYGANSRTRQVSASPTRSTSLPSPRAVKPSPAGSNA